MSLPPQRRAISYHHASSPPRPSNQRARSTLSPTPVPSTLLIPLVRPLDPADAPAQWLRLPLRFDIAHEPLEIEGYQMYAVEKWIVERNRPVTVLTVYTGDPDNKITVVALRPSASLSVQDSHAEWEKALHQLRRDGARPKETPHGILMATSLAHFRSDYTIVHIPDGDFLAVKEQLYTNINLLRMGCSGRSALTLQEPSDTTKDRFISSYHLPETTFSRSTIPAPTSSEYLPLPAPLSKSISNLSSDGLSTSPNHSLLHKHRPRDEPKVSSISKAAAGIGLGRPSIHVIGPTPTSSYISNGSDSVGKHSSGKYKDKDRDKDRNSLSLGGNGKTKDRALFNATVLELVKLVQAGLSIFGLYTAPDPANGILLDGLLCDSTVEGIQRWIADIGEPCVGLEPTERIADPMFVSALISLVLSIRNKLAVLGYAHVLPRDPFLNPQAFCSALSSYLQAGSPSGPQSSSSVAAAPAASTHNHGLYTFSYPYIQIYTPFSSPPQGNSPVAPQSIAGPFVTPPTAPVLTRDCLEAIEAAYDTKTRVGDSRKVRRVLKGKLEDLTSVVAGVDSDGTDGPDSRRRSGTLSGGEEGRGAGGLGDGKAGGGTTGQMIGSLANGLRLGSGSASGGPGAVLDPTVDLAGLVNVLLAKEPGGKGRRKVRERESVDLGVVGLGYGGRGEKEKGKDVNVAGTVRALWSGRVADVVCMREWELERSRELLDDGRRSYGGSERFKSERWRRERLHGVGSDGDVPDDSRGAKSDGRSTEDDSDMVGAGGKWSGRVQKKLESWAGRARKKGASVDLSAVTPSKVKTPVSGGRIARPTLSRVATSRSHIGTGPQSPTLPPMVFAGDGDRDPDDDDLLSSGQVSPISPSPFNVLHEGGGFSVGSSTTNLNSITSADFSKLINSKRPWARRITQTRVSSWSDPVSARDEVLDEAELDGMTGEEEGDRSDFSSAARRRRRKEKGKETERSRLQSLLSISGSDDHVAVEEPLEMEEGSDGEGAMYRRKPLVFGPRRRRSFHDLESLEGMRILTPERMRIDVELCGQMLIMTRREEHLRNVAACVQVLTASLSETNAHLREDYQTHLEFLIDLEMRTKVLADIDAELAKADKTSQATNTLRYEAEQFRIPDLWHTASPSRGKVLALREKVFGTGGRRLPAGAHGAHGRFNRLQWTIDGRERVVDYLGRTESEAEEEEDVDPEGAFVQVPEEEEEDVVEHPGIRPMWLLRFFMGWGTRWGAAKGVVEKEKEGSANGEEKEGSANGEEKEGDGGVESLVNGEGSLVNGKESLDSGKESLGNGRADFGDKAPSANGKAESGNDSDTTPRPSLFVSSS